MSYSTVRDVLQLSERLHRQASNLFLQLREGTQKERVDLVMQLLAAHEEHQADAVARLREDTSAAVLAEWHQLEPQDLSSILDNCESCHDDMSVDEVTHLACTVSDYLTKLYQQLSSEAASDRVRQLFDGLADYEKHQKILAVRAALSSQDW